MSVNVEVDWLGRWGLYSPTKEAIFDYKNKKSYTYGSLHSAAKSVAYYLKNLEVKPGDRVAVLSQNRVETVILFFALQRLGAILVPINFRLTASEIEYILQDSGSKILFYEESFKRHVEKIISDRLHIANPTQNLTLNCISYDQEPGFSQIIKNILLSLKFTESSTDQESLSEINNLNFEGDFDSSCMILYTSGTTGFPKGAVLTNKMLFWNAINTALSLNVTQEDVTINFAPLFHTGGWNVLMTPFFQRGARVIFFEKFDAEDILKVSQEEKVTLLFGVPTMLTMMSESKKFQTTDLSSIRYMVVGGEPMPLTLIKTWHDKGVPVRQGFGLTEFGPNCFSLSEKDAETKMGSIGRPNFYVKTKIVNSEGFEVLPGDVGELLLSGPSCMKEYWNNEKATLETLENGWLRTGDLVKKDKDDYFYVVGRKKEMFISGGENVYPVEIERVLQSYPMIAEAAVVGVADDKWGEVGHAFLSIRSQHSIIETEGAGSDLGSLKLEDLKDFCRKHLAGFKVPKHFSILDQLPKGDSGKINKKILRNLKVEVQSQFLESNH